MKELCVLIKLLHHPTVLDFDVPARLIELGGLSFGGVFPSVAAAAIRAAAKTLNGWRALAAELKAVGAVERLFLCELADEWWSASWDMPAFASHFDRAAHGTGPVKAAADAAASFRSALSTVKLQRSLYLNIVAGLHVERPVGPCVATCSVRFGCTFGWHSAGLR